MGLHLEGCSKQQLNRIFPTQSLLPEIGLLRIDWVRLGTWCLMKIEYDNFPFILNDEIQNR